MSDYTTASPEIGLPAMLTGTTYRIEGDLSDGAWMRAIITPEEYHGVDNAPDRDAAAFGLIDKLPPIRCEIIEYEGLNAQMPPARHP